MSDAWVWDMYRPARFVKNVKVLTFKDVNVEELAQPDLEVPAGLTAAASRRCPVHSRASVHSASARRVPSTAAGRRQGGGPEVVPGARQGRAGAVRRGRRGAASGRAGHRRARAQLALRRGRDRHRRARRPSPGDLRGQDAQRDRLRHAARGGDAAPRPPGCGGSPARWLAERGVHPTQVRFDVVGVLAPGRGAAQVEHVRGVASMTLARTRSVALVGVVGHVVEVEADLAQGLPGLRWSACPTLAVRGPRPDPGGASSTAARPGRSTRITLNLSPASLPKGGSGFDLALAVCVLAAAGSGRPPSVGSPSSCCSASWASTGVVRPVRGVLPAVLAAAAAGRRARSSCRAATRPRPRWSRASTRASPVGLAGRAAGRCCAGESAGSDRAPRPDPGAGSPRASARPRRRRRPATRRGYALEVAAAGGHHLFLHGPPGRGQDDAGRAAARAAAGARPAPRRSR